MGRPAFGLRERKERLKMAYTDEGLRMQLRTALKHRNAIKAEIRVRARKWVRYYAGLLRERAERRRGYYGD